MLGERSGVPTPEKALILVVDHDPHIKRLERVLEEAGYRTEFVADGAEGLARAREIRPRLVISEIILPGADGLKICRALKSDPATAGIAVLMFSILSAENRAREAGADAFLRKPLDETLVDTVAKLLPDVRQRLTP